ncbi:MAG: hypothetical protein ACK5MP_12200 [Nostocoides sp.]
MADTGTLQGWTVRTRDGESQIFGLIGIDGADNVLLHRVLAPSDALTLGMRLKAQWGEQRSGEITDIDGFVPE